MPRARTLAFACLSVPVVLTACKEGGAPQCINPADPLCVNVATVDVRVLSAPEDTVVQVGSTAQMVANAEDAAGAAITTLPVAWSSTTIGTATVAPVAGLMTAVAPGTTAIRAVVDGVQGQQAMVVVNAPLPLITTTLSDTVSVLLRQALGTTPRGQIVGGLATCATRLNAGNIVALDNCLTGLTNVSAGGVAADSTLLGILDVFFVFAQSQLPL
ncbi:MAG: hypothetical protein ABL963_10185 [Longimicrobiales bacterium]